MESKKKKLENDTVDEKKSTKVGKIEVQLPDKKSNKLVYIILVVIIIVVLLIFLITSDKKVSNNSNNISDNSNTNNDTSSNAVFELDKDDSLSIGVGKYLEFLWMVDGAFNDSRYKESIKVNNKVLKSSDIDFKCNYDKENVKCKGENFEKSFEKVFASNITYDDVYGDGHAYRWYEKNDDGFFFNNLNSCNIERMSRNQTLEIVEAKKDKLTFKVKYTDNVKDGIYKGEHVNTKEFVLIKENSTWKVSKAYYHDPCFMDYYIPNPSA